MKLFIPTLQSLRYRCLAAVTYGRKLALADEYQASLEAEVGSIDPQESQERTILGLVDKALASKGPQVLAGVEESPETPPVLEEEDAPLVLEDAPPPVLEEEEEEEDAPPVLEEEDAPPPLTIASGTSEVLEEVISEETPSEVVANEVSEELPSEVTSETADSVKRLEVHEELTTVSDSSDTEILTEGTATPKKPKRSHRRR